VGWWVLVELLVTLVVIDYFYREHVIGNVVDLLEVINLLYPSFSFLIFSRFQFNFWN
jgi:hypothetical protein